jgi:hypothetical protein
LASRATARPAVAGSANSAKGAPSDRSRRTVSS